MAVKIVSGNDMDLTFVDFQLFPRLEGMNPSSEAPSLGSIEILENMWRPYLTLGAHAQRGLQYLVSVCVSVTQHLTCYVIIRATNETSVADEGRKF